MTISFKFVFIESFSATLNFFFRQRRNRAIYDLASRWLSIFECHGVTRNQIPRLLPSFCLPLDKLNDESKLLELLSDELCTAICNLFNVERSWLDGDSDRVYAPICLDRSIDTLLAALIETKLRTDESELLVFRTSKRELAEDWRQFGALIIRSKIYTFEEKSIYRYTPIFSLQNWGNQKQRYYAVRAIWAAHALGFGLLGGQMNRQNCKDIVEGTKLPESCMEGRYPLNWHPDDYVDRPSNVAKGSDLLNHIVKTSESDGTTELIEAAKKRLSEPAKMSA